MKIGICYCGGCNPRYDRGAAAEFLRARLSSCLLEPAREGVRYDGWIALSGCNTGCIAAGLAGYAPVWRISCREDLLQAEQALLSMQKGMTEWTGTHCIRAG